MPRLPHDQTADRLLFQADAETDPAARDVLLARAAVHAELAQVEAQQVRNLIAVLAADLDMEHPLAALIIRRNIRRRLGLFPALTRDGENENGGD
jgi:hypothetical protein